MQEEQTWAEQKVWWPGWIQSTKLAIRLSLRIVNVYYVILWALGLTTLLV